MEIYLKVIKENYVNFNGRARRKEFWMFQLFLIIITGICTVLDNVLGTVLTVDASPVGLGLIVLPYGWLYFLCGIFHFLPSLSVLVRRLHDVGKSGWWYFIGLIPIVNFWLLYLLCKDGDNGENSYGNNPKV
tara:strand:- start:200 stop:595 length:396 start_codon:yes stop_codon:yes gene_type:complete